MSFVVGTPNTLTLLSAASQTASANPSGTTSTTSVMMGLNGAITPVLTGRVLLIITGVILNNTIGDGSTVQASYGTGAAPSNAGALAGTQVGAPLAFVASTAAGQAPFAAVAIITGLVNNTTYWLDAALKAVTGGTATIKDVVVTAVEF